MTIVRYEPFSLVNRFNRELNQLFGNAFSTSAAEGERQLAWVPSVDVREEDEQYVLHADLPGVEGKDIQVTADDGVLTIKGERHFEKREESKGFQSFERVEGAFMRRFTLPENALADKIKARHNNGVLEIVVPKQAAAVPKRVTVEVH